MAAQVSTQYSRPPAGGLKASPRVNPSPSAPLGTVRRCSPQAGKPRLRVACPESRPGVIEGKPGGRTSRHVGERRGLAVPVTAGILFPEAASQDEQVRFRATTSAMEDIGGSEHHSGRTSGYEDIRSRLTTRGGI